MSDLGLQPRVEWKQPDRMPAEGKLGRLENTSKLRLNRAWRVVHGEDFPYDWISESCSQFGLSQWRYNCVSFTLPIVDSSAKRRKRRRRASTEVPYVSILLFYLWWFVCTRWRMTRGVYLRPERMKMPIRMKCCVGNMGVSQTIFNFMWVTRLISYQGVCREFER
jgi:hypothetical protein